MKMRTPLYLLILALGVVLAVIQYSAYRTQIGTTVTIPEIGFYEVPKTVFPLLTLSFLVMFLWIVLGVVGSAFTTEWFKQTRFWTLLTATFFVIITFAYRGNYTFIPWDITWLYLLTEGVLTVREPRQKT